jgi:uncharacterized protein YndB with AHSA1/START domain
METIRHRVGITAPISDVYEAVATPDGVAGWWTREVQGDTKEGGELSVGFGGPEPAAVFELVELNDPSRVVWGCRQGPDEWLGTTVEFDLREDDGETIVVFSHAGWRQPVEYMHHCSTSWGYFLLSLKHGLEGGQATPWPDSEPVARHR